jgi:hypothetical protein
MLGGGGYANKLERYNPLKHLKRTIGTPKKLN